MDRLNIQRYVRRIKVADAGSGNAGSSRAKSGKISKRRWAIISVFVVLTLMAGSVLAGMGRLNNGAMLRASLPTAPDVTTHAPSSDSMSAAYSPNTGGGQALDQAGAKQAPNAQSNTTAPSADNAQAKPWDRKIIRTATLQVTVKDVSTSLDKVRLLAAQHGGYVFQLDSHQDGNYTVSSITIQVPTQEFDRIMPELRKLDSQVKKITSENVSSSDVTEEYTDQSSQLRNLQATEARMLALQQKADKLEDILALDQQLRQVQGDIERIQGRLNFLTNRSDMSSITVSLSPTELAAQPVEPEPSKAWDPGQIALQAWNASLEMLSSVATVAITIGVFLWWAAPLLLVFALAMRGRRRAGGGAVPPAPPSGPPATTIGETGAI